jgi:hypothetical protein
MKRKRGGLPPILGYEPLTKSRRAAIFQSIFDRDQKAKLPTPTREDDATDAPGESETESSTVGEPANLDETTNCLGRHQDLDLSELEKKWEEFHNWRRDQVNSWSAEDARLAAENIGMWGERARDGSYKPVVSQRPKEEYL